MSIFLIISVATYQFSSEKTYMTNPISITVFDTYTLEIVIVIVTTTIIVIIVTLTGQTNEVIKFQSSTFIPIYNLTSSKCAISLRSKRFRGFFIRSRHFSLFGSAKIRASAALMEKERGRGGEARKGNACPQTPQF